MQGKVYLIGAGPGDPDLITVKGLRLIRSADVIAYDRLIPMALLDEARVDAELIDVGKAPSRHRTPQEAINALIIEHARQGRIVIRLKGGDPFVFGRGGEEALACHAAGIPFEVVPGISSAIAVPAYAGIPVTHRKVSTAFTVITGHEDPAKGESTIDYAALVKMGGTLVILMGVERSRAFADVLMAGGRPTDTPVSVIQEGTTRTQKVVRSTLDKVADDIVSENVRPPAIIVVGTVAGLATHL
jgi:uroporphyrin-III C-methyltransferase